MSSAFLRKIFLVVSLISFGLACKKDTKENAPVADAFALLIRGTDNSVGLWYSEQDGTSFTKVTTGEIGGTPEMSPAWSSDGGQSILPGIL